MFLQKLSAKHNKERHKHNYYSYFDYKKRQLGLKFLQDCTTQLVFKLTGSLRTLADYKSYQKHCYMCFKNQITSLYIL